MRETAKTPRRGAPISEIRAWERESGVGTGFPNARPRGKGEVVARPSEHEARRFYRSKVTVTVPVWIEEGHCGTEAIERALREAVARGAEVKVREVMTVPAGAGYEGGA